LAVSAVLCVAVRRWPVNPRLVEFV